MSNSRPTKDRLITSISLVIIGMALSFLALLTYWNFQPQDVFTVKDHRIHPLVTEVKAGGVVPIQFSFCKLIDIDGEITRSFVSRDTEIQTPTTVDRLGKTCLNDLIVNVPVPSQASTGEYRIKYLAKYKVNPIKTIEEEFYSEPFRIIGN